MPSLSYEELKLNRWESLLSSGESIYGNTEIFPDGEQKLLTSIGIKSLFIIPIFVGSNWWGFIAFDECKRKRDWTEEEISALKNRCCSDRCCDQTHMG